MGRMNAFRKSANRRFATLADNLRAMRIQSGWLAENIKFLFAIHAGSYAVQNHFRISTHYLNRLAAKRARIGASPERWRPKKNLVDLPPYSQAEAFGRRLILEAYFEAIDNKLTPAQAERIANVASIMIFGKTFCDKQLRRLVALIEDRGGIANAPIEAFATGKSIPHAKKK